MRHVLSVTVTLLSFSLLYSCGWEHVETGPTETYPVSIDTGQADRANIELNMGAGEMHVAGGAGKLMEGNFEYNVPRMKPIVSSSRNGLHTTITVRQPEGVNSLGKVRNLWDLQFANNVLLDMSINCGAGQANLNLGDVRLRDLSVRMGAGQVDLDLTGKPQHDYQVTIHGGVGQATVHLPHGVGIWANAHGGIGSINVEGLQKRGDHWENDLYEKAKINVRVEVNGGIGEVRLIG